MREQEELPSQGTAEVKSSAMFNGGVESNFTSSEFNPVQSNLLSDFGKVVDGESRVIEEEQPEDNEQSDSNVVTEVVEC